MPDVEYPEVEISDSKNPEHGDFACNFALVATKRAGLPPRAIAEKLQAVLSAKDEFEGIEVAGPGFLNLKLKPSTISRTIDEILKKGTELGRSVHPSPKKLNVEFVSVNPNGPITVGSARGAAFGDTLSRVFDAAGHDVHREYYINDGVNSEQMRLFAESVIHYYKEMVGLPSTFPEKGYKGDYVQDVAKQVFESEGASCADKPVAWFQKVSQDFMLLRQREDLAEFGVRFDTWFSEQALHESGEVDRTVADLKQMGVAYELDGALWLKATQFGDEKDRVLVRANGRPTYITSDIAYHRNKFSRGFDKLIDIWGPDHHGYIPRMNAAIEASGHTLDEFEVVIFQIVRFVKDGQPAPMRKRDGNIYELRDLVADVGTDVARFFYLMRSHDTHMDFDIDLATKQSDENPVFYAQYAHARICAVMRKAAEAGLNAAGANHELLVEPKELALVKKICDLPYEVRRCAEDYGVHRLTTFAVDLARTYHHFYDACRVILPENPELAKARLSLCEAARVGLRATFDLLGVSAPERMERVDTNLETESIPAET